MQSNAINFESNFIKKWDFGSSLYQQFSESLVLNCPKNQSAIPSLNSPPPVAPHRVGVRVKGQMYVGKI